MTRTELIEKLDALADALLTEVDTDELSDYARREAFFSMANAISFLEENYDPEEYY